MSERFQNLIGKQAKNTTLSERFQHTIEKQNIPHHRSVSKIELKNKTYHPVRKFQIIIEKNTTLFEQFQNIIQRKTNYDSVGTFPKSNRKT
jgi:hypothetical protein